MLGWHVSVYRQVEGRDKPAAFDSEQGDCLAMWQADVWGLDWLDTLVKFGMGVDLGGDGYPLRYTVPAEHIVPVLVHGIPSVHEIWHVGEGVPLPGWKGKTTIDWTKLKKCDPGEWLLVEAWDES